MLASQLYEFLGRAINFGLITLEDLDGLLLGTRDIGLRTASTMVRPVVPKAVMNRPHLSPTRGTPAVAMLNEEVARPHAISAASEVLRCTWECVDFVL